MSRRERPIVASVEDADESGNIIEETARYASSVAPSSPAKEQPNTGRARRDKARRGSSSPVTTSVVTDSDSTVHPRRDSLKKTSKDRDKSVSSSKKALMASSRPPVKHTKTAPSVSRKDIEATYYGVDPTVTPAISRPRAKTSRPSSYYGPSRPPPANARFYANPPPGSLPTSYPPPPWMGPGPGPGPGPGSLPPFGPPSPVAAPLIMQQPPLPPPSDYFARPLESRFGSTRPQSSMGFRPPPRALEYDDFEEPPFEKALARRPSSTRRVSKNEEDRRAMPPPPRRPASARPGALAFRPPPSTPASRRVDFEDHETDVDDPLFNDLSPLGPGSFAPGSYEYSKPIPFRPRPSFGDLGYDVPDYHTEVAAKSHRRNSYYGGQSTHSANALEEKIRQAARYQDDISGGPPMPLTAETLRKAGKSGASSRSTWSSGSHDESDYRQSAATRTTRSTAPNDEDVTIRVKGNTVLKFGNAEMQCEDGAEINISSRSGNAEIRTGSDRSSYIDPEDRRTRIDFPTARERATSRARSRARSYSRAFSKYDAAPSRYDAGPEYDTFTSYAPPLPPPYPEYPSSYSSRHGDAYFH
ncbi:hypothetical protein C8A03DRAFT_41439 [Achaetomium macrosporum]|uniref:Uncharacterized protein n=1 Tax=Achaetomium macrosporum TaxID=79813 RepID=A0AAN7HDN9_9PEZI|nr:hypothetical protein C8A03DRAFT_41439 [Achaetomium macrosporum]